MAGYIDDLESETLDNEDYRKVLFTGPNLQLVVMSVDPGDEIGLETHNDADQFIRIESGDGTVVIGEDEFDVSDGYAAVIPSGTEHNIINDNDTDSLKLYMIYSSPQHPGQLVERTKGEEDES